MLVVYWSLKSYSQDTLCRRILWTHKNKINLIQKKCSLESEVDEAALENHTEQPDPVIINSNFVVGSVGRPK